MNVYSIFDKKGCCYELLFHAVDDASALRTCDSMVFSRGNQYSTYPEDFDLYHIGTFDQRFGTLEMKPIRFVMNFQDRIVYAQVQQQLFQEKLQKAKEEQEKESTHE